jgi:asparagine synthetase B (glutamine-hydrolysing)
MNMKLASQLGSFAVFGFTKSLARLHEWSGRLGIIPRAIDFGDWGHLFFYSSYGDVEETEKVIGLKLGFLRSPAGSPLSTQQLIEQKTLSPRTIDHQALRGNALVACLGKTEANFSAYQTLLSAYQLHYSASGKDFLCSDSLRCLVAMLGHVELNEDLVPMHFTLLYVPGRSTLLRNVKRLRPGELLQWKEGKLDIHMAQDLRFVDNDRRFDHADDRTAAIVHERLGAVVGAYVDEVERSGRGGLGNLLSGGIDSSLLQLILNERSSHAPRSFSYAPIQAPHFEFEVEYARQASEVFGTEHTFVHITPEDFAGLLIRATDILAHPVISDPEVNKLGLAEYLQRNVNDLYCFVNGLASGSLFGNSNAPQLKQLEVVGKIPGSKYALAVIGRLLKPFSPRGKTLLKAADMLAQADDPDSFLTPLNTQGTHKEFDLPRRFFGDEAILKAFRHRRELVAQYHDSNHPIEKIHLITLLTHMYEVLLQSQRLFLALNKEQIFPYTDEDIIRLAFAFPPQVRYAPRFIDRYLFRKILTQKSSSTIAIGRKRKGGSSVFADLWTWMQSGRLHEMIREIELPGFLSRKEFEDLVQQPNWFLWSLLTFDLFQKRILKEAF